jgi:hypothetical protein
MERGIGMVSELAPKAAITAPSSGRPPVTSYDSGYEHSLEHWLAVQQLVEAEPQPGSPVRWSLARAS